MASRLRSALPLINRALTSSQRSSVPRILANPEVSRNFATKAAPPKEKKVKVPLALYGISGNYSSALYIAATKLNLLDKVESELLDFLEASKNTPTFALFMKDLSVRKDTRVKAITDICTHAKFSEVTRNFLVVLAENGRLPHLENITKRFTELTMAYRGEVKAIVTTVIELPAEEEKELKETLQSLIGKGKKVHLEQKIDPSILGGIVVEFSQKVFDASIRTRARQMERFLRDPINIDNL
ncbi:hypothetical protein DCAR_0207150 [Daucus carota subsp. sativus]|uniref:ATP synthase subunit O, mitochondrial n=1 Tax=Daucus carota subsp. sativus TaxID=79200 RepID=A0AAF1APC1_DAUCS|nr:PREDICTED: ATP synthase subunit O, mitochondrial [Daucus carota subsp. sativus]WOG87917.1 hypothetical protein DCAR_0207150 [Daucus carota subsp. sativus]